MTSPPLGLSRTRVLALVQAGGAGSRMDVLTRERAKPTLPFAGVYQLVDFPLSNLTHSGITDVWVSVSFQGSSMEEQVANGRPWELDRTRGGLRLLMPQEGTGSMDEEGFARGNADELYRRRLQLAQAGADVLLVMSADHVYRYDYRDLVEAHLAVGAECTVLTTQRPLDQAGDHATVETAEAAGPEGTAGSAGSAGCAQHGAVRVTRIEAKPDEPRTTTVSAEVVAYDPAVLVEVVEELHRELGPDADAGDSGLGDFAEHLLPRFVERGRTHAVALPGYWRDLGRPARYLAAHREVLLDDQGVLDHPGWPILTQQPQRGPARVVGGATVVDSLVAPGAHVAGRVVRSVVGPGVVVAAGAEVHDSVLFTDSRVESGAVVHGCVVDTGTTIGRGAVVGSPDADLEEDDGVTLLGRDCRVADGAAVPPGSRLEPGTTA